MDPISALGLVFAAALLSAWVRSPRTERMLDTFAAGFLPYRESGWPRGVQEGEPVHFNVTAMTERGVPPIDREPTPDTPAEVFEIDDGVVADIVDGHVVGGTTLRD